MPYKDPAMRGKNRNRVRKSKATGVAAAKRAEVEARPGRILELMWGEPQTTRMITEFLSLSASSKAACKILMELSKSGQVKDIQSAIGVWWVIPDSPGEKLLLQRVEQDKKKRHADRYKYKAEWRKEQQELREAAWLYPVKRVVSQWKTTMPPRAVRSVFELAGQV